MRELHFRLVVREGFAVDFIVEGTRGGRDLVLEHVAAHELSKLEDELAKAHEAVGAVRAAKEAATKLADALVKYHGGGDADA